MLLPQCRVLVFVLLLLGGVKISPFSHGQTLQIDSLKANYLNGFLDFLRWDGQLVADSAVIGVVGSREMVNHLNRIAAQKSGRRLEIVTIEPTASLQKVHILFVARGHREEWKRFMEESARQRILLVGEEDGFAETCGCIEFVVRKNRLQFFLNPTQAEANGIEVSSKLIELALAKVSE